MKRFFALFLLALFLIVSGFEASSAYAVTRHRKAKYIGGGALGGAAIGALAGGGKGALIGAGAGAGAGYVAQRVTTNRHRRTHCARTRTARRRYYRRS